MFATATVDARGYSSEATRLRWEFDLQARLRLQETPNLPAVLRTTMQVGAQRSMPNVEVSVHRKRLMLAETIKERALGGLQKVNTVPAPCVPPNAVVPYKLPSLPCTTPANGRAPSLGEPLNE